MALAEDSERLFSLRQSLETRRDTSAAFDTPRWVTNLEAGYTEVWTQRELGHAPVDVDVHDSAPVFIDKQPTLL